MYLINSSAAALTDFKLAKSSFRNMASFPVRDLSSLMAADALDLDLAAMYTVALWERRAWTRGL